MGKTDTVDKFSFPWIEFILSVLFTLALIIATDLSAAAQNSPQGSVQISTTCPISSSPVPIAVRSGSQFTITLPSNHTTGYEWQVANKYKGKVVKLLNNTYVEPQKPMPGKGGVENWTFKAVGKGKTTIIMNYIRPFEPKSVPAAMTQKFTITVQ